MKRVFSGMQPTGNIHIGNYLGAIKNWVDSQGKFDNIFCVVDLHALTIPQNPKILGGQIREIAGLLLACGINPEKSALFVQSHVHEHSELAWILNCFTPMGWLEKMTQYKEKIGINKERRNAGLFDYPVLMAADILLYDTHAVPVGEDQVQHVELARDVAKRFNSIHGDTFVLPEALVQKNGARIMGLQNPEKKMSKSEGGENNSINLLDSPNAIRSKIMKATTDSGNEIKFGKKQPGLYNLLTIYKLFSGLPAGRQGLSEKEIEKKFESRGYSELKKDLAELVVEKLSPIQKRYQELSGEKGKIEEILKQGAEKVRPLAEKKLKEVKEKIGLI